MTPAQAGTSVGSYATILTGGNNLYDSYGILININTIAVSTAATDSLTTIGIDPAGGTSYSNVILNLLSSCAGSYGILGCGVWYYFPIFIKAGSQIAAIGWINNATVGTQNVNITLMCQPRYPEFVKCGSYVDSYGVSTSTASGTNVTPGTTSEGAWTGIQANISRSAWWFQVGMGVNDSTMTKLVQHLDVGIGDSGNKRLACNNTRVVTTTGEALYKPLSFMGCDMEAAVGDNIYARAQGSTTADSNTSVGVYAVGG